MTAPAPTWTWCHSTVVTLEVGAACAALDWLCARSLGPADRPGWWTYPAPALSRLRLARHTQVGPPEHRRYGPHRRLDVVLGRVHLPAVAMELELYPWDSRRTELFIRPLTRRTTALACFAAVANRLLTDINARLTAVWSLRSQDDLDDAALELLLSHT